MPYDSPTVHSTLARIDTKTGRDRLAARREPYWSKIARERHLGFRKTAKDDGYWIARYRSEDGRRQYRALGELTPTFGFDDASESARIWFGELERGIRQDAETVADACRLYVDDRRRQKGEGTAIYALRAFERTVFGGGGKDGKRHARHPLAGVRLDRLRTRLIEEWRDGLLKGGLTRSTVNRMLTHLRAALNYAVRHRLVRSDVAIEWRNVQLLSGTYSRRTLYLDRSERRALLDHASGSVRDLIEAAALTGARAGEVVSARVSQFDARTASMTFHGKTGSRTVPLAPAAVALFKRLAHAKLPGAFLLTDDHGQSWPHSGWDGLVRAAAAAAKLPDGTCLYTLRHSFITAALTDGMSPLDVARIVGTSLRMIDKNYGHLCHYAARERLAAVQIL